MIHKLILHPVTLASCIAAAMACNPAQALNITNTIWVNTGEDTTADPQRCSLRDAISNVNAGGMAPGGNACAPAAKTVNDETTLIMLSGQTVTLDLPLRLKDNHVVIYDGTVDGAGTSQIFRVTGGNTHLMVHAATLQHGSAGMARGGAIEAFSWASVTLDHAVVRNNVSIVNGGGISVEGAKHFRMAHTLVEGNKSLSLGGGILLSQVQSAEISNSRISSNEADAGGALYAYDVGAFTVRDTRLEGNSALEGDGGGIYSFSPITLERVNFEANRASQSGGGMALYPQDLDKSWPASKVIDSKFSHNEAGSREEKTGSGGALYVMQGALISGSSFESNWAGTYGGALDFGKITTAAVTVQNSTFTTNWSPGDGAAIAFPFEGTVAPDIADPMGGFYTYRVLNNTFSENIGGSQIYMLPSTDARDILFINNIVTASGSTPACSGYLERLQTKRLKDDSQGVFNVLWPSNACTSGFDARPGTVSNAAYGWYFDQRYHVTTDKAPGDPVVCSEVGGKDQFQNKRTCRLGAVEAKPAQVKSPTTP